jgi:indolepyruvate ferredoxin oxidoreductase, beta subunit
LSPRVRACSLNLKKRKTTKMDKKINQFNILIVGTGGQGLITLLQVISEAALLEGYDVKTSELHGLSQRGGSVEVHIRFGKEIDSPMVAQGRADLILALEEQEALNGIYFAGPKTKFLINQMMLPIPLKNLLPEPLILEKIKKITKDITLVPADNIAKEKLQNRVVSGIYLLAFASFKNMLPLKQESIKEAVRKIIPAQFLECNLQALELAKS